MTAHVLHEWVYKGLASEMRGQNEEGRSETRKAERLRGRKGKTKTGKRRGKKPGRLKKEKQHIYLSSRVLGSAMASSRVSKS